VRTNAFLAQTMIQKPETIAVSSRS